MEQTTKPVRSIWRSWKIRLTGLFLLLIAGLVLYVSSSALTENRLRAAIEAADHFDPNWRIADLEASRIRPADKDNAALLFVKAAARLPKLWPSYEYPSRSPSPASTTTLPGKQLSHLLDELEPPRMLPVSAFEALRAEVSAAGPCLDEARRALNMPAGNLPTSFNAARFDANLGTTYEFRHIEAAFWLDTLVKTQSGDLSGALESAQILLLASRAIGDQPLLLSMLIRQSVRRGAKRAIERVVAQGEPATKTLASLQHLCEEEAKVPLFLIGIRASRATAFAFMEAVEAKSISFDQVMNHLDLFRKPGLDKEFLSLAEFYYLPGVPRRIKAALLEFQNRQVEIARLPVEEQVKEWPGLVADAKKLPLIARRFVDPTIQIADAFMAHLAQMRCLVALIAAERYRQERGRWPTTMEELTPGFLAAPLLDPFTGKPLILRRTGDGLIIYSVSSDGRDDGGTFLPNYRAAGSDVGVRLWDPDKRRQPAQALEN